MEWKSVMIACGGKAPLKKALKTLETVRSRYPGLILQINTVMMQENYREIPDLLRFIQTEYNPSYHSVLLLRGTPLDPEVKLPPLPEIRQFLKIYDEIISRYRYNRSGITEIIAKNYHRYMWDLSLRTLETQVVPCYKPINGIRSHR